MTGQFENSGKSSAPLLIFFAVFALVLMTTGIIATAITWVLPEVYASTARIKVEPDQSPNSDQSSGSFTATTCEVIRSAVVLNVVIKDLNLNQTWGKKYFNGEQLKTSETLEILKQRMLVAPVRNSELISITVYGDDRMEAAQIANAIAGAYRAYRLQSYNGQNPLKQELVQVTDPAEPGRAPVKPNKTLNVVLGFIFGGILGSILGGIAGFVTWRVGRRK